MNRLHRRATLPYAPRSAAFCAAFCAAIFGWLLVALGAAPAQAADGDDDALADALASDAGAALVTGQLGDRQRDVVRAAVEEELRKARWTLRSLEGAAASQLADCFAAEHPWPCLVPAAAAQGVARLLAIRAEREPARGGHQLRLAGQLGALAARRLTVDARYCGPCGDLQLATAARQLAQRLLAGDAVRGDATRIELRTTPADAVILLDGRMVEAPGGVIATSPGWHTVHLQRAGYRAELRHVNLSRGQRLVLDVTLPRELTAGGELPPAPRAKAGDAHLERYPLSTEKPAPAPSVASAGPNTSSAPPPGTWPAPPGSGPAPRATHLPAPWPAALRLSPRTVGSGEVGGPAPSPLRARWPHDSDAGVRKRRRLGWALAIGGAALLAGGGVLLALDEDASPDPTRRHHPRYFDSAPAGLLLAVSGGTFAAAGLAVILISPSTASSPSASQPASRALGLAVATPF